MAALAGVAEAATEQFLKGRVDPLLAIPDLMDLARGEVAGPGQVDPASVRGLPRVDALGQVNGLYQAFAEPRPALEIGLCWLAAHRPAPAADTLVRGDFRTGNLMVGQDGLRSVLDWELAHRGDPGQDLGWLCTKAWRFGSASPVGGFGTAGRAVPGAVRGGAGPAGADR